MVLGLVTNMVLQVLVNATPGSINEALSVPLQQIAYVYNEHNDDMEEELKEQIRLFIPNIEDYNPYISDPIKFTATVDRNIKDFFGLYLKMLNNYKFEFINAFLILNAGYLS